MLLHYKQYYGFSITLTLFLLVQHHLLVTAQDTHRSHSSETNWNKGLLVASCVALIAIYCVFVRSCLNRYPWWSARGTAQQAQGGGLSPSILESFPVFIYSEKTGLGLGLGLEKGSLECSVCLSQFEKDEKLRMLPKCKHVFHLDCVNRWLAGHSTCPFCRDDLAPRPDESTQTKAGCVGGSGSGSGVEVVDGAIDIV